MKVNKEPFSIMERIKSFRNPLRGLAWMIRKEHNSRVHLVSAILAIGLGAFLNLGIMEWISILVCIMAVFITELLNTSLEVLSDKVEPNYSEEIKIVKDLASAAVFVAAVVSLIIGCIIFIPKICSLLQ